MSSTEVAWVCYFLLDQKTAFLGFYWFLVHFKSNYFGFKVYNLRAIANLKTFCTTAVFFEGVECVERWRN